MLETLLPITSATIHCSRAAIRRLTMPARRLPFFSSRVIAAREDAVSAVSLPENKNDISRQIATMMTKKMSAVVIVGELSREECTHVLGIDVGRNEGPADTAGEDERELAALDLLVLRDQVHQRVDCRHLLHLRQARRQPDTGQMRDTAVGLRHRHELVLR